METIEKLTIRCFLMGMLFMLIWFYMFLAAGDWMYGIHSQWFALSKHQFVVINYCGMALVKICIFLFFLVPYIACKLCTKRP